MRLVACNGEFHAPTESSSYETAVFARRDITKSRSDEDDGEVDKLWRQWAFREGAKQRLDTRRTHRQTVLDVNVTDRRLLHIHTTFGCALRM